MTAPAIGKTVRSLTTRGKNAGVVGEVRWAQGDRLGVKVDGEKSYRFIDASNVEVIDPDNPTPADVEYTIDPADVAVYADKMGREVIVIPDDVARALRREINRGWCEIPGVADGYSRKFPEGTWVYAAVQVILAAYAASDIPDVRDDRAHDQAAAARQWAGGDWPHTYAFIVGESGFDATEAWWRDYDNTTDLHLHANPSTSRAGATGRRYVTFGG